MDVFPSEVYPCIDAIDHSPGGKLAIGSSRLTGRYWNGSIWLFKNPDQAPDNIYSPDSKYCSSCAATTAGCTDIQWLDEQRLALASDNGDIELWMTGDSFDAVDILAKLTGHDNSIHSISVNCTKNKIVSGSLDTTIRVWDLEREACTNTFQGHSDSVWSVSFRQDESSTFASASEDGSVIIWDLRKERPAKRILNSRHHITAPLCVAWNKTGKYFAVGYTNGSISCFNSSNTSQPLLKCKPHCRNINALAFCPQRPAWLASVSNDCTVNILDINCKELRYQNNDHEDFVRDLSWNPIDGCLRTCGWDTQIIRHTTAMIEEGLKNKLRTESIETSVITKVGCNGVLSPEKNMME